MNEISKFFFDLAVLETGVVPLQKFATTSKIGLPCHAYKEVTPILQDFTPEERRKIVRKARKLVRVFLKDRYPRNWKSHWGHAKRNPTCFKSILQQALVQKQHELEKKYTRK